MMVSKINWIKYEGITRTAWKPLPKYGIKTKGTLSNLYHGTNGIQLKFYEDAKGIAPGQSAVFYEGDDVIGGGVIMRQP